ANTFSIDVKLISITQGARSWLGVEASGITISLALDPLSVSLVGGALKLNKVSGAGASKLDWASFTEGAGSTPLTGLPLPHLDVAQGLDLHLSGTVEVELADVFSVTATGSLDLGQLNVAPLAAGNPAV